MLILWTEHKVGEFRTIEAFKDAHPEADINEIDGIQVVGHCEGCDKPILQTEADKAHYGEDGWLCPDCQEGEEP